MTILQLMPNLEFDEMRYVQEILKGMNEGQQQQFAILYNSRRRDPTLILLTALLGFIVIAGVHRFLLGQIGMGLLYFFTGGICLIGTIVDLVNHKKLAFEYNARIAQECAMMIRSI
jgi:TM2 domain-containing membrane protein YozV